MAADPAHALRILFITLEFRAGTFSGNGVYATAQVRALAAAGHKVFVVSAQPLHSKIPDDDFGVEGIVEVPVSSWHRLDAGAPWREYAAGVLDAGVTAAVRAFAPDVVLAVDWSALQAVRHLAPYCWGAPYVYLNYRVFTRTAVGDALELIRGMEAAAMAESLLTVALSRSDAEYLEGHVAAAGGQGGPRPGATARKVRVLLPALREDVRQLQPPAGLLQLAEAEAGAAARAAGQEQQQQQKQQEDSAARPYLSCVVRLSPEKEPERFIELVEAMAAQGLLTQHGLTPLLLGVANDEYAQALKSRLRAAAPDSLILERFMGPADLADLYRRTRINFHPSTYDAYGMTIVEAASQGAPSVVHDGDGAVGATDLLRGGAAAAEEAGGPEVLLLDLRRPAAELAAAVGRLLADPSGLRAVSVRALRRARSWDEAANAAELVRLVRQAMTQCSAG